MSLDLKFLGSFLDSGLVPSNLPDYHLSPEYFTEDGLKLFEFVKDHFSKYGQIPSLDTMRDSIGIAPDGDSGEPPEYYAEQIIQREKESQLKEALSKAIDSLKGKDVNSALAAIRESVAQCSKIGEIESSGILELRETAKKRCTAYFDKMANPEYFQGVPWPWPYMNKETGGMHPGELYFIVARLKQGKTWTVISMMDQIIKSNSPAMVVSMEMPVDKIARRFDSLFSSIGFSSFSKGSLTTDDKEKYAKRMDELSSGNSPVWIYGNGRIRSVQDIELIIEEKKPSVVLIDGVYLMGMEGLKNPNKYERVSSVVDELQRIAQRKQVAIVATTQFNRTVKKGAKTVEADNIGFAYEVAQAADMVMGLVQDDDMKDEHEMILKVMERREGETFNLKLRWDFETMDFSEIGVITDDEMALKKAPSETPDVVF